VSTASVDQRRVARPSCLSALLLLGAASCFAFPTHAQTKGAWSDDVSHDQTFSRVLVVGISPDFNQRCPFEREMAAKLKGAGTMAFVSCDVMPLRAELTCASIDVAVAEQNADAVLATSLISKEWDVQQGGTRDTRGHAVYKAVDSYYGVYGTVVAADFHAAAPLTSVEGEAHVTTKIYETRGATVVYTVDTRVRNIETRDEGLAAVTEPIAKKLRKEGLIR